MKNGREVLVVRPKSWQEYFTTEELTEMSQPGYFDEVAEILIEGSRGADRIAFLAKSYRLIS